MKNFANILLSFIVTIFILFMVVKFTSLIYKKGYDAEYGNSYKIEITKEKREIRLLSENNNKSKTKTENIKEENILELIKNANYKKGERLFKKCSICHSIAENGKSKVGPNLYSIVGDNKARDINFKYSDNLQNMKGKWDEQSLNLFIKAPREYIKNTKMAFNGIKKAQDRADLIFYLQNYK